MKALFVIEDFIIDPLAIGYLSSYLKKAGHEVDLVKTKRDDPAEKIKAFDPDMLCYSVTTGEHMFYQQMNLEIQSNNISVFGGAHPTFFPKFAQYPGVDVAVRGEGFETIVDVANAVEGKLEIEGIDNTVIGEDVGRLRPAIDKTKLLRPDRALMYKYPENADNPIKNIMTSFGCPYQCPYCYSPNYKQMYNDYRVEKRSIEDVMLEVEDINKYPLDLIFFQDDIFPVYKADWLSEFCEEYKRFKIPFHIQVRIELITEDIIKQLKEVGLFSLTFAIESGDPELRENILERKTKDEVIAKHVDILHKHDIKFRTENMVGIPHETWETAMATLDLNIKCNPTIGWASLYQPYPGTKLGDKCIEWDLFDGNVDTIDRSFFDTYKLKVRHARMYERLQKLFPIIVSHPRLRRIVKFLCRLPLNRLYAKLYKRHKQFLYDKLYVKENDG